MNYPELDPLMRKAEALKSLPAASDIYKSIVGEAAAVSNDFMARQLCRRVISMCHPKAWGDRQVEGFDSNVDWIRFLGELADIADDCGAAVNQREKGSASSNGGV